MLKNIVPKNIAQLIARSLCAALLLMAIPFSSALAATYEIKLFARGGGAAGTGGFEFDNNAVVGCLTTSDPSVMINSAILATVNEFCVKVLDVEFSDQKTSAEYGPNIIKGQFVEGLEGTLEDGAGNTITFSLNDQGSSNPNAFTRTYQGTIDGQTVMGTYAVTHVLGTVPEPGILALFGFGLGTLAWLSRRKTKR